MCALLHAHNFQVKKKSWSLDRPLKYTIANEVVERELEGEGGVCGGGSRVQNFHQPPLSLAPSAIYTHYISERMCVLNHMLCT